MARPADLTLDAVSGDVFGGEVNDTENVKRPRVERDVTPDAPAKRRRGKVVNAEPPPPTIEEHQETARGFVVLFDSTVRGMVRARYEEVVDDATLREVDARFALRPEQQESLVQPIARGLQESGVRVPWWAGLGLAAASLYLPRLGMLKKLDALKEEHDKREAAKAPANGS